MYAHFPKHAPIVQKYGGTSVGSTERIKSIAARIADQYHRGHNQLAIVVSARSGETNRLIELIHEINPQASGHAYDMALAAGEQVSVALMAAALEGHGLKVVPLLAHQLSIMTDDLHTKARIKSIKREVIDEAWRNGAIAVVAGFQGVTKDMTITTLGRGGSDTSAVALACALEAAFCEINTDVDGVFTADPRIVSTARLIESMDYETALEMASLGSKVLHPRCVELGAKFQMPLIVRNTFTPDDHQRTRIMAVQEIESLVVSGVTLDRNIARLTITGLDRGPMTISAIFDALGKLGINVDIIIHDKAGPGEAARLGFTVTKTDLEQTLQAITSLSQKPRFSSLKISSETGLSKVSVVGVGMHSYAGVAGRTFKALTTADINIHMISTSEIKISCVVGETQADPAIRALHAEFLD